MSQNKKRNLWQKLKRLLASRAPYSIIHVKNSNHSSDLDQVQYDTTANHTVSAIDSHSDENQSKNDEKFSELKTNTNSASPTPIVDYLKDYFDHKQWHYTHYQPRAFDSQQSHHLSLRMKNKQLECGYLCRVQENNALLAVYGILPFLIPETHQTAALLLITQINYDMLIGNLEMDVNDGEIRYKNALDVELVGINNAVIEHLLQSVVAMTTVVYEVFDDLLNTQDPSEDMPILLGELREKADARTFFLATQKMQ